MSWVDVLYKALASVVALLVVALALANLAPLLPPLAFGWWALVWAIAGFKLLAAMWSADGQE